LKLTVDSIVELVVAVVAEGQSTVEKEGLVVVGHCNTPSASEQRTEVGHQGDKKPLEADTQPVEVVVAERHIPAVVHHERRFHE